MGKPQGKVKIKWSPNFAYAIGLLTTDGNLSSDRRHIIFVSKDPEQIDNFQKSLGINLRIGKHSGGYTRKKYYRIQIGDVLFYKFLLSIGLMPNKTKIIGALTIPNRYYCDFLRGHLDGDGTFYSYWDPCWRSSFMFYTTFNSASKNHIDWLRDKIYKLFEATGYITKQKLKSCYQLKYAKEASRKILSSIYYAKNIICLSRKRLKIQKALSTINLTHL